MLGHCSVHKNAQAFILLENLGQQIFFRDLLTFNTSAVLELVTKTTLNLNLRLSFTTTSGIVYLYLNLTSTFSNLTRS